MKILFNLISILIVIAVICIAFLNTQTSFEFTIWGFGKSGIISHHINLINVILGSLVAGIMAGIFWASSFYLSYQGKLKEYQRKLEKTSVQSSEDSSKVAVLESKIEVLEKALQSALEKSDE